MSAKRLAVAVLDDYNNLARSYLGDLRADVTVFHETILPTPDPAPLFERLLPFDVICTMRERTPLPRQVLVQLPRLKYLLTTGMKNRGIDSDTCKEKGIVLAGTPSEPLSPETPKDFAATVQHTWALILALVNNIPRDQSFLTSGSWLHATPLNTFIGGKTLGLLGLGRLGQGVARIAKLAFGMKVVAWSPNLTQEKADDAASAAGLAKGDLKAVSKKEVFESADILSVHLVLSERSRGTVKADDLALMKPSAFLVNTSRGPLIDEADLLDCLERGAIRGAALDVFDVEPLPVDSRWRTTKWGEGGRAEVVMTPHTGYTFEDGINNMWRCTAENLKRIVQGEEPSWQFP